MTYLRGVYFIYEIYYIFGVLNCLKEKLFVPVEISLLFNSLSKSIKDKSFDTTFPEPITRLFSPLTVFYSPSIIFFSPFTIFTFPRITLVPPFT